LRVDECSDGRPKASRHCGRGWNGGVTLSDRDSTVVALCRRIQNTGQFRRQKRSETKTDTKVELLFRAEKSKIADFRAGYASRADFCELLERNLKPLYLLAFLLTPNHKNAECCFSMTAEECLGEQAVFKEWAQSWLKRSLIKNVIGAVSPASSCGCAKRDFWSVEQNEPASPLSIVPRQASLVVSFANE